MDVIGPIERLAGKLLMNSSTSLFCSHSGFWTRDTMCLPKIIIDSQGATSEIPKAIGSTHVNFGPMSGHRLGCTLAASVW